MCAHNRKREREREREREGLTNLNFTESDIVSTLKVVSSLIRTCYNTFLLLQKIERKRMREREGEQASKHM